MPLSKKKIKRGGSLSNNNNNLTRKRVNTMLVDQEKDNILKELYKYIKADNSNNEKIKLLLSSKNLPNLNTIPEYETDTLLFYACENENNKIIDELIKKGANPNIKTSLGKSLVYTAISENKLLVLKKLLLGKADVNILDDGETILHYTIRNFDEYPLRVPFDDILLHGADINFANKDNITPLMLAVHEGKLTYIKQLLKHGANINLLDDFGYSALCYAIDYHPNNIILIKYLLDNGAEVNIGKMELSGEILSPLTYVCAKNYNELLPILLNHGADLNITTNHNLTGLHICIFANNIYGLKFLLNNGANPNIIGDEYMLNRSPLFLAAESGTLEMLKILLQYNADPNLKDSENNTPLEIAEMNGFTDCVKELQKVSNVESNNHNKCYDVIMIDDVNIDKYLRENSDKNFVIKNIGNDKFECASLENLKIQYKIKDIKDINGVEIEDYNEYYECNNKTGRFGLNSVNYNTDIINYDRYLKMTSSNVLVKIPYWFGINFNGKVPYDKNLKNNGIYELKPYKKIKSVVERKVFSYANYLSETIGEDVFEGGDHCVNNGNDLQTYILQPINSDYLYKLPEYYKDFRFFYNNYEIYHVLLKNNYFTKSILFNKNYIDSSNPYALSFDLSFALGFKNSDEIYRERSIYGILYEMFIIVMNNLYFFSDLNKIINEENKYVLELCFKNWETKLFNNILNYKENYKRLIFSPISKKLIEETLNDSLEYDIFFEDIFANNLFCSNIEFVKKYWDYYKILLKKNYYRHSFLLKLTKEEIPYIIHKLQKIMSNIDVFKDMKQKNSFGTYFKKLRIFDENIQKHSVKGMGIFALELFRNDSKKSKVSQNNLNLKIRKKKSKKFNKRYSANF